MSKGKTFFITGVMRSGKTAHIIMQIYNMKEKGIDVKIIKPSIDTREKGIIKSRALNTYYDAETFSNLEELKTIFENTNNTVVFVDESQFMTKDEVLFLIEYSYNNNIKTFFYGLKNSYTGEMFEGSKVLFENVDSIRELKTDCDFCDRKATTHLKKVDNKFVFDGEKVGVGDEEYFSVCPPCFFKAKKGE